MAEAERLEALYSLGVWPEDPRSAEGRKRYDEALRKMKSLIEHEWIKAAVEGKRKVKVVDLCGGTGIGGVALAKALAEKGFTADLTVLDLRESALEVAKNWGREELGKKVETINANALELHRVAAKADIVLMYGFSAPHFDPWSMVKLASSVASVLERNGVFVLEEVDRRYSIFIVQGYARVLTEAYRDGEVVANFHVGYNAKRGTIKRALVSLPSRGKTIAGEFFYWGLAELMAILWVFFQDVDFLPSRSYSGFILARRPRGLLKPSDFSREPKVLAGLRRESG